MFGFDKKEENEQKSSSLKVVFEMELLDRAISEALKEAHEVNLQAAKACGEGSHAEMLAVLEDAKLNVFSIKLKRKLEQLSEKE